MEYQLHLTCGICSFPITNTSWSSWSNPSRRGGTAIAVGWHVFSLVLDPEIPIIPSKRGCITYTSGLVNHDDQLFISLYPPNKHLLKTNISPPKSCLKFLGTQGGIYCIPRFDLDVGAPGAFQRIGSGSSPWRRAHVSPMRRSNWKKMAAQTVAIPSCGMKRWEFLFLFWWIFACFFVDLWDPESTARVEWF